MKLALDHHYSPEIAAELRRRGHDVIVVADRGWHTENDETLLGSCLGEGRALMTNNVADFAQIVRRWSAEGRRHAGLIFTSDASMPRGRKTIGSFVQKLDDLLRANKGRRALSDRVTWL